MSGMMSSSSGPGGPVVQGIATLTTAMTTNIIPDQEYLLQGSILDPHVDVLKHRLGGLCDNVDPSSSGHETFQEREMVFTIRGSSGQPLTLRIRRPLDPHSDIPWQLRYVGQAELKNRATVVRSCYEIACSSNAIEFLLELGCRLDYEFVAKGFIFRKGRMKVIISKIFKLNSSSNLPPGAPLNMESLEPQTNSHLVELSILAPSGNDAVAEDMKNFAEQLKPLVLLDKIDPPRA
ncbi:mediator of RNA polymerase II transcription subunit 18 isoform X2 [Lepeophtheirus salmonis]|uniref:Mediator of RNA polymerase II transcription subunit 18 n=2 Tax=Lepeophtheirus salmonis TaxID=72036 RepID=A0A0K2SW00_LEPSM|nr:mediator of RNA polymerase II transcription subunit 18-like [Lepeophtheirus salmonis]